MTETYDDDPPVVPAVRWAAPPGPGIYVVLYRNTNTWHWDQYGWKALAHFDERDAARRDLRRRFDETLAEHQASRIMGQQITSCELMPDEESARLRYGRGGLPNRTTGWRIAFYTETEMHNPSQEDWTT